MNMMWVALILWDCSTRSLWLWSMQECCAFSKPAITGREKETSIAMSMAVSAHRRSPDGTPTSTRAVGTLIICRQLLHRGIVGGGHVGHNPLVLVGQVGIMRPAAGDQVVPPVLKFRDPGVEPIHGIHHSLVIRAGVRRGKEGWEEEPPEILRGRCPVHALFLAPLHFLGELGPQRRG